MQEDFNGNTFFEYERRSDEDSPTVKFLQMAVVHAQLKSIENDLQKRIRVIFYDQKEFKNLLFLFKFLKMAINFLFLKKV